MDLNAEFFRSQKCIEPELCYVTSIAVGFAVSIYRVGLPGDHQRYQVMRWDESQGPGKDFWDHHLAFYPQFFDDPTAAAASFVECYRAWVAGGWKRN